MSKKQPLTEGHMRGIEKGANKPTQASNLKPTEPPPAPKPQSSRDK